MTQGAWARSWTRAPHIFIATGGKTDAIRAAIEARDPALAASILRLCTGVTILLDEAAASKLELLDFYKEVWEKGTPVR